MGAITWGNGTTAITGTISASNSLIGSNTGDNISDNFATALSNGNYIVRSSQWKNGTIAGAGAVTYGDGTAAITGFINSCNSITGSVAGQGSTLGPVYNPVYGYLLVSKSAENVYVIYRPAGHGTAANGDQATASVGSSATTFGATNCTTIATVRPSGTSPVSGSVTAKAYVQSSTPAYNGQTYIRRYFDIAPAANANTATARITLYYSQADFDDYNANNGTAPDVPTGPADAAGIANLRITQQHGTSASGAPGSYTGWTGSGPANVAIDPADADIVWNNSESRWEVSFQVTGFSGFFAYGANNLTPLPVSLLTFNATAANNANKLDWSTATETAGSNFTVERSVDGSSFGAISDAINGKGNGSTYIFYDESPVNPASYYRLQMTDGAGKQAFSHVAVVRRTGAVDVDIRLSPVPAHNYVTISTDAAGLNATLSDMQGRTLMAFAINSGARVNISSLAAGVYVLRLSNGFSARITKE